MTGQQLKAWRLAQGMKHQTEAAKALGVSYRTYQRWEKQASVDRLVELACQAITMRSLWPSLTMAAQTMDKVMRAH